jgi:hypothetical protein
MNYGINIKVLVYNFQNKGNFIFKFYFVKKKYFFDIADEICNILFFNYKGFIRNAYFLLLKSLHYLILNKNQI